MKIKYGRTGAVFITDEFEIYSRLIEGKYFEYKRIFNKLPLHTVVSRESLLDAMTRARMCTKEKIPVKFKLEGNSLDLSIRDQTTDYRETVELQAGIEEALTIGFNAKLVQETLKSFDYENVRISFGGPKMPMIVETEDNDFKSVVLPVAIN